MEAWAGLWVNHRVTFFKIVDHYDIHRACRHTRITTCTKLTKFSIILGRARRPMFGLGKLLELFHDGVPLKKLKSLPNKPTESLMKKLFTIHR